MVVAQYQDANTFLATTGAFLEAHEPENNSFLGTLAALPRDLSAAKQATYLVAVVDDNQLPVVCAIVLPGRNIVFSAARPACRHAVPIVAGHLHDRGLEPPGLIAEQAIATEFRQVWVELTGCSYTESMRQGLYVLRKPKQVLLSPGSLRLATEIDQSLVEKWNYAFSSEALGKADPAAARAYAQSRIAAHDVYLWDNPQPVCMAAQARPTRHGIAINHVYTPPANRRKGYATSCVSALTSQLLASGRTFCTLYADLSNRQANDIYLRIGYELALESTVLEFTYRGTQGLAAANQSGV